MKKRMLSEFLVNPVSSICVSENKNLAAREQDSNWTDMLQTAFQTIVAESSWSADDFSDTVI